METDFSLGSRRILSTYRRALRVGFVTGLLFCGLMSTWLLIANRVPSLEQYAGLRNMIAGILGLVIAVIPVVSSARSPRAILLSGGIAWGLLSLGYFVWTFYFDDLADRWSTLHVIMMGAVVYGLVAALAWLGRAALAAREHRERQIEHPLDAGHRSTLNRL